MYLTCLSYFFEKELNEEYFFSRGLPALKFLRAWAQPLWSSVYFERRINQYSG